VQGVAETEVVVVPAHTFRRHVAFHLEQLALFALGTHESPDAPPLSGSTNSQDIASAPDYNLIEHFLDTQEKFDDDETLPMDYDVSPNGSIESFSSVPKLPTETATDDVRNSDVISSPLHERPKITAHKESVSELQSMLEFGPGMESIDLGLSDPHRYLIHRGDLLSMTGKNSVATHTQGVHAILLDNYFILAQPNAPNLKDFVRYTITQMVSIYVEGRYALTRS
jgi:hypothetical protein